MCFSSTYILIITMLMDGLMDELTFGQLLIIVHLEYNFINYTLKLGEKIIRFEKCFLERKNDNRISKENSFICIKSFLFVALIK